MGEGYRALAAEIIRRAIIDCGGQLDGRATKKIGTVPPERINSAREFLRPGNPWLEILCDGLDLDAVQLVAAIRRAGSDAPLMVGNQRPPRRPKQGG